MTKKHQKALSEAQTKLNEAFATVNEILEAEEETLDNMSDYQLDSERGEEVQNNVDLLEEASGDIEDALDIIGDLL
jgi:hypothetical protein